MGLKLLVSVFIFELIGYFIDGLGVGIGLYVKLL